MTIHAASRRLAREYKVIQENPPEFIIAHPSERNILEWHYIITGPPQTPYHGGQYWGTLVFTPNYPYAPPAIRMHTPSGRFQPSTRLCLSISDFHPKSFNPAWGISTILVGLLSFMTSDEMTTGSISATEQERRWLASRSRWWNSTGGSGCPASALSPPPPPPSSSSPSSPPSSSSLSAAAAAASPAGSSGGAANPRSAGTGVIRSGDGGARFRAEWPELHEENCRWMLENRVDSLTGNLLPPPPPPPPSSQAAPSSSASSPSTTTATSASSSSSSSSSNNSKSVSSLSSSSSSSPSSASGNTTATCALAEAATLRRPLPLPLSSSSSPSATRGPGATDTDASATAESNGGSSSISSSGFLAAAWIRHNKLLAAAVLVFGYMLLARIFSGAEFMTASS